MKKALVLIRGNEQYIFIFDTRNKKDLFKVLDDFVANHDLSFNKCDANILNKVINKL